MAASTDLDAPIAGALQPVRHPGAWKAADFEDPGSFTFELRDQHLRALHRALGAARATGRAIESLSRDDFPLDDIAADLDTIRHRVQNGRGIVLLRGFPATRYSREDTCRMFWGLGTHFGHAVSQSLMGDRLGHVTNVSGDNPAERGYRSRRELGMHTDSDDMLMMLCLKNARSGGQSRFVSALTVYNEMLATHPGLLPILMRGFRYHWRGEQADGEEPITRYRVPVFSHCNGLLSCVFLRAFIDMAAHDLGEPLSQQEVAALDVFEQLCERSDLQLALNLAPGDIYVVNNYTTLHSRTAFEDHDAPQDRRYLLRLWLKAIDSRPVIDAVRHFYRDDGITARQDASTIYVHDYADD
jgi:alpha-ketoglutarate-dependent taurine dioxygenase